MKELNKVSIGDKYYDYIRYGVIHYFVSDKDFYVGDFIHFVDNDNCEIADDDKNVYEIIHIEDNHVGLSFEWKIISIRRLRRGY